MDPFALSLSKGRCAKQAGLRQAQPERWCGDQALRLSSGRTVQKFPSPTFVGEGLG
jgi:hypothetical protein